MMGVKPNTSIESGARRALSERAGIALFPVLAGIPAITPLIGSLVDNQIRVRDSGGYLIWISDSNTSGLVTNALVGLVALLAILHIFGEFSKPVKPKIAPIVAIVPLTISVIALIRAEFTPALMAAVAALALASLAMNRHASIGVALAIRTSLTFTIIAIVYAFLNPDRGQLECREDKCGALGSLVAGYFAQENVFAIYALMGLLATSLAKAQFGFASRALFIVAIALSGSRIALAIAGVYVLFVLVVKATRFRFRRSAAYKVSFAIPLFASTASAILFFWPGLLGTFTGRADIYRLLLESFVENPIIRAY